MVFFVNFLLPEWANSLRRFFFHPLVGQWFKKHDSNIFLVTGKPLLFGKPDSFLRGKTKSFQEIMTFSLVGELFFSLRPISTSYSTYAKYWKILISNKSIESDSRRCKVVGCWFMNTSDLQNRVLRFASLVLKTERIKLHWLTQQTAIICIIPDSEGKKNNKYTLNEGGKLGYFTNGKFA